MIAMHSIETELRVAFHDVDFMGVVWHGRYAKYLEVARDELMRSIGYSYIQMVESGFAWPVVDMRIKYVKSLYLDQKVTITAEVVEWENRLKIKYTIRDSKTGERLTKAHTTQVALDMKSNEMSFETPSILREKLGMLS